LANPTKETRNIFSTSDWIEYLLKTVKEEKVLKIFKSQTPFYFLISLDKLEDDYFLITLQDITQVKENESIKIKQSKMHSMGEMLSNIAHQWRQPLSMVSTLSTGLLAQKELGVLSDEKLENGLENINTSIQYMSKVIDEFSSFYQVDKEKTYFSNTTLIDETLKLVSDETKSDVEIIVKVKETELFGLEKEIK
jgi:signal transduction histidine kinase